MALTLIRSASTRVLFDTCAARFLEQARRCTGPTGHPAQLWLIHRNQRDLLLARAVQEGIAGWLNPPIHFFSALPELFGITGRPIGLLARRELVSSIGHQQGRRFGITIGNADASITRGHMLDSFFGDLLAEGVTVQQLETRLAGVESDEFAARRNAWLAASFEAYLAALQQQQHYDARSIHALVAQQILAGGLGAALGGAQQLHIYGLYSARSRRLLLSALRTQNDVAVFLYTNTGATELAEFADRSEELPGAEQSVTVQPAPDANRELHWVARSVKRMVSAGTEPHEIAVVARTGLEDTRRALYALQRAGIPATARTRTPLSEIAALKAVLDVFRAAAERWSYRVLRSVIASPYFRTRIDLRALDHIATQARPSTLAGWENELVELIGGLESESGDPDARRLGLNATRVRRDLERFRQLRSVLEPLDDAKPLGRWLGLARDLLGQSWFRFRQRVCDPPEARYDLVRLDQRGVHMLERLLEEWGKIDDLTQVLSPTDWFRGMRALLEGQELVLTTPGQKGVQILEAHDAALTPFSAVFLVHGNDGEFPRLPGAQGLFSEEERRVLRGRGLPMEDRAAALARERVLWEAVTGAERVHISFRTSDPRGTPLLPSLLVPAGPHAPELPRDEDGAHDPLNAEEDTRRAAHRLARQIHAGDTSPLAAPDVPALRRAVLNAFAEHMRGAPDRTSATVNAWNGELRDPVVLAQLSEKYNETHLWSASQLETYTQLPFRFLLERVLDLQEMTEAEEDTNRLTIGGVAHAVLEKFYNDYVGRTPPEYSNDVVLRLVDLAAQVFTEWQQSGDWLGIQALWEQRRGGVVELLSDFLAWDLEKLGAGRAAGTIWKCEYELGGEREQVEISGLDVRGAPVRLHLRGRIDRIDRRRNGELVVIDYKSSSTPSPRGYEDGAILQGPLYLAALQAEGHNARKALYRSLRGKTNAAELSYGDEKCERALQIAFSVPERIRRGLFEAAIANSQEWKDYHPELAVRRTHARVAEGSRFDV